MKFTPARKLFYTLYSFPQKRFDLEFYGIQRTNVQLKFLPIVKKSTYFTRQVIGTIEKRPQDSKNTTLFETKQKVS